MNPDILFELEGQIYKAPYEAYRLELILLPDGRLMKVSAWQFCTPPFPDIPMPLAYRIVPEDEMPTNYKAAPAKIFRPWAFVRIGMLLAQGKIGSEIVQILHHEEYTLNQARLGLLVHDFVVDTHEQGPNTDLLRVSDTPNYVLIQEESGLREQPKLSVFTWHHSD